MADQPDDLETLRAERDDESRQADEYHRKAARLEATLEVYKGQAATFGTRLASAEHTIADLRADIRDAVTALRWAQGHLINGHAKRLDPLMRRLESRTGERP